MTSVEPHVIQRPNFGEVYVLNLQNCKMEADLEKDLLPENYEYKIQEKSQLGGNSGMKFIICMKAMNASEF